MIRAVLFDVGGTLHTVQRDPGLADRFSATLMQKLQEVGVSLPIEVPALSALLGENAERYKQWSQDTQLELPNVQIWNEYYLKEFQIGEAVLAPIAEELSVLYDATRVHNVPQPDLLETMEALRKQGMILGVISNIISTTFVPKVLEDYGIASYMSCVIMSEGVGVRKPNPAIFEIAAKQVGVPLSEMAYVGDTLSRDVLGCRNAGVGLSIQISNPSIAHRDVAFVDTVTPDYLIHKLSEIPAIIAAQNT